MIFNNIIKRLEYVLRNEWPRYLILVGWIIINLITFMVVFFDYEKSLEYFYLREMIQQGLAFSRASAFCINMNAALILIPVCRNFISYTRLFLCFPKNVVRAIDKHISYHRYLGYIIIFLSIIHTFGHIFNIENFINARMTKNGLLSTLSHLPTGINPVGDSNPIFEAFKLLPGYTGILLCLVLSILASSSSEFIRRFYFNIFWYSHQILACAFFLLISIHGLQGVIKKQTNLNENPPLKCYQNWTTWSNQNKYCDIPNFSSSSPTAKSWIWILPSIIIFSIERLVRFIRSLIKHELIDHKLHPSQVLQLNISNNNSNRIKYRAGQYIYLNVSSISFFEWHPFTITSAPNDSHLSVHIRCEGDWTSKLQQEIQQVNAVSIDGPYGTCAEDVFKYSEVILIGAGIGVTPYSSILKHIWHISKNSNDIKLKKITFFWICPSLDTFEWFGVLLKDLELEMRSKNKQDLLEYKLYLTRGWSLREAKRIATNHDDPYDLFTGLEAKTNYGRPNFELFFNQIMQDKQNNEDLNSNNKKQIGVFFCGPKNLSTELHKLCNNISNDKIQFLYNKENF